MGFGPFLLLALMESAVTAATLALTAVGLSLVFGVMRVVNVAHGEFFMLGAVSAWFITTWVGGPAWASFLVALALARRTSSPGRCARMAKSRAAVTAERGLRSEGRSETQCR